MIVRELMTTDVVTVDAGMPLKAAALLLARNRISGVPVLDAERRVVGVLSEADVLVQERGGARESPGLLGWVFDPDAVWREKAGARTVGEAMSAPAICIGPDRPVHDAAAKMLDEGVNRLPVVELGRLVGIVTRADLVRAFVRSDDEIAHEIHDGVFGRALWLEPDRLTVTVRDGVAIVFGVLDTPEDVRAMVSLIERVPGVVRVESRVSTEGAARAGNGAR